MGRGGPEPDAGSVYCGCKVDLLDSGGHFDACLTQTGELGHREVKHLGLMDERLLP